MKKGITFPLCIFYLAILSSEIFGQRFNYEFTYGFSDLNFKENFTTTFFSDGEEIQSEVESQAVGAIGFSGLFQFEKGLLFEMDVRYKNTSLSGNRKWRVKYLNINNESQIVTPVTTGYVNANMGIGYGLFKTYNSPIFLNFLSGFNLEYGHKLSEIDVETQYSQIGFVNQSLNLEDDFLLGYYLKLKLGIHLFELGDESHFYLTLTPSYQKSWKVYDVETSSVDGFTGSETRLGPSIGAFNAVFGFTISRRIYVYRYTNT